MTVDGGGGPSFNACPSAIPSANTSSDERDENEATGPSSSGEPVAARAAQVRSWRVVHRPARVDVECSVTDDRRPTAPNRASPRAPRSPGASTPPSPRTPPRASRACTCRRRADATRRTRRRTAAAGARPRPHRETASSNRRWPSSQSLRAPSRADLTRHAPRSSTRWAASGSGSPRGSARRRDSPAARAQTQHAHGGT